MSNHTIPIYVPNAMTDAELPRFAAFAVASIQYRAAKRHEAERQRKLERFAFGNKKNRNK